MRNLDHALRLIEAVVKAVAVPVTLKMRLGWDDRSRNAPTLARRAEAAGVRMITVHGRTRCQFYDGTADWTAVRAVRDAVTLPLIVNGDIDSVASARAALAASGADGVMIGRGAQGQPWLLGHIAAGLCGHAHPPLQNDEKYKITAEYYEDSLSFYGKSLGGRQARKHLAWALERTATEVGAPAAVLKAQRAAVLTADDPDVVLARLRTAFDALSAAGAAAPRRAA
jgi:nifR3 family TIM-barrel protein